MDAQSKAGFRRKLLPGSVPTKWKDTGEEKPISGNPGETHANQVEIKVKRIGDNVQVSHLKTERKKEY